MSPERVLVAKSLATIWFVAKVHEDKIGMVNFFVLIPIALSFETSITKTTSKDHPNFKALPGTRRIILF
jgi:hypothetical protein